MEDASKNATAAVVVLVLCGLLAGYFLGSCGDAETETVVQTVEVTDTKTVRRTRTVVRTVTVPADDAALADTFGDTAATSSTSTTGDDCSSDYAGACVPLDQADVSCADLGVDDIDVIGADVYGLDPDEDGVACEQTE